MKNYEYDAAKLEILEEIWQGILDQHGTGELGGQECAFCGYGPAGRFGVHEDDCLMPKLTRAMRGEPNAISGAAEVNDVGGNE